MSPATSIAKSDTTSKLRQHFGSAMYAGEQFMDFITKLRAADVYAFWPRRMICSKELAGVY
jgi:hypothetical protein